MPVITRSAHPSALWPGVYGWFGQKYNEKPAQWSRVFDKRTGTKAWEDIVESSGFGLAPVKTEGAPIQYDTDAEGIKNRFIQTVYALGYMVTREELDDNQYLDVSRRRSGALARSMRTTAEYVHWNIFNRGFNGSYIGGDGVSLFNTAHPSLAGNQSNVLTVAADLTQASLEAALSQIRGFKDRRGLPIAVKGYTLVVGPENEFNAYRLMNSVLTPGSNNNDPNAIRAMGLLPGGVVVSDYLTDPDAWFIVTDVDEGLLSIWRNEVELEKDQDFDTENAKAKARMRFVPGWGDFRSVLGTPGA